MSIKITADHANRRIFISIGNATHAVRQGLGRALIEIGKGDVRHTKALIKNPPKTGRMYGKHQASAHGEAPANQTGRLMKSIRYKVYGWSRMEFGDTAPYGKFLEEGTTKMKERPHLIRTVSERAGTNYMIIKKVTDKHIKRANV